MIILAFFSSASLIQAGEPLGAITENSGTVYVIREIEFDVDGRTRPYALINNGEFKYGERIIGRENLDRYLALKRQLLINRQVLEEVRIEYFTGESEEDGALPVKLLVYVKDTWNIIVLPYPKYDSNEGFSLTLKMRDYNFLGTMSALRVDLGYEQKESDHSVNFSIESDTPFQAAGLNWSINFDHFFSYTFNEPLYYQNVTGLSLHLPLGATTLTTGFDQYITLNEENTAIDKDIFNLGDRYYGPYGSTELFVSWKIPINLDIGGFGELSYNPGLSGRINYPYAAMDEPRKPVTTFSHSVDFGRVDWIGNYRKGLSASVGNSYNWYFDRVDAQLKIALDGGIALYRPFAEFIAVNSRLKYRQWWQWSENIGDFIPYYYAGDSLRGILNGDIRAHRILSFNLDLPVRVLRFRPTEWFKNEKLEILNFEMQLSPFTDMALLKGPYNKLKDSDNPSLGVTSFSFDDMINTAGLEIFVFPAFFRSLKIRASFGYNISRGRRSPPALRWGFFPEWDEIFIGIDYHY